MNIALATLDLLIHNRFTPPISELELLGIPYLNKCVRRIVFCDLEPNMSDQSERPSMAPDPALEGSSRAGIPERRKSERYSFIATADVYEIRSQAHLAGRCSDLSLGGCYVDTIAPFPIDSPLRITIQHDSREFHASAAVIYCHPSMGMGIRFTEMTPESRKVLRYWVGDLSGEPISKPASVTAPAGTIASANADSNMRLVLNELITLLVRKKIFTEMEGAELIFRVFR